jgi:hypothetical protein
MQITYLQAGMPDPTTIQGMSTEVAVNKAVGKYLLVGVIIGCAIGIGIGLSIAASSNSYMYSSRED